MKNLVGLAAALLLSGAAVAQAPEDGVYRPVVCALGLQVGTLPAVNDNEPEAQDTVGGLVLKIANLSGETSLDDAIPKMTAAAKAAGIDIISDVPIEVSKTGQDEPYDLFMLVIDAHGKTPAADSGVTLEKVPPSRVLRVLTKDEDKAFEAIDAYFAKTPGAKKGAHDFIEHMDRDYLDICTEIAK